MNKNNFSNDKQQGSPTTGGSGTGSTSANAPPQDKSWEGVERHAAGGAEKDKSEKKDHRRGGEKRDDHHQGDGDGDLKLSNIRDVGKNLGEQLEHQMRERPYVVIGAVAGVGFVAGSLLGSRLGQIAVALAGGYLVRNLIMKEGGSVQKLVKEGMDKLSGERASG